MDIFTLKDLRERANLTQKDIADATGTNFQMVKAWEAGGRISKVYAEMIMNYVKNIYPVGITHWANEPDDCLFCRDDSGEIVFPS